MTNEKEDKDLAIQFINQAFDISPQNNQNELKPEKSFDYRNSIKAVDEIAKNIELSIVEKKELDKFLKKNDFSELIDYPKEEILKHYIQGLESVDIVNIIPNTTIGGIVYLKTSEEWPKLRLDFLNNLEYNASFKLALTKHRSITMLSTLINLWHDKVDKGMFEFITTGDKAKLPPNMTIKGFKDYEKYIKLLKQIDDVSGKMKTSQDINEKSPKKTSVSITTENVILDNSKKEYVANLNSNNDFKNKQKESFDFFQQLEAEEKDNH